MFESTHSNQDNYSDMGSFFILFPTLLQNFVLPNSFAFAGWPTLNALRFALKGGGRCRPKAFEVDAGRFVLRTAPSPLISTSLISLRSANFFLFSLLKSTKH